jgi:hypothetical protein
MKSISKRAFVQSAFAAAAVASIGTVALAQDDQRPMPPLSQPVNNVLTLACCKCLGTGASYSLNTGTAPWKLISGPAGPAVAITSPHSLWAPASPAQWIGPSATPVTSPSAPGGYTYQLRIVIPKCVIPSSVTISGKYWGDDEAYMSATGAAGSATPAKASGGGWGFQSIHAGTFSYTVPMSNTGGVVTLTIRVPNAAGAASPAGLLVIGDVKQRCATDQPGPIPVDPPIDKKE